MRAKELLSEINLDNLKNNIISTVNSTTDSRLLTKIYDILENSDLGERIFKTLLTDADVKYYVKILSKMVVETPGSSEEKIAFAENFSKGYIDVDLMLSGNRVHFDDLLKQYDGGKVTPFLKTLFNNLKSVGLKDKTKGPGEFALASLSPHITLLESGDLQIKKYKVEVKASSGNPQDDPEDTDDIDPATGKKKPKKPGGGGRLGTTGSLNYSDTAEIINKYLNKPGRPPLVDVTHTLNLKNFNQLVQQHLQPAERRAVATELFHSVFKTMKTDIEKLINVMATGNGDILEAFTQAAFNGYKSHSNFDKLMLINFSLQELKMFDNAENINQDIYPANVHIISREGSSFAARNILPTVTLRPQKIEKVSIDKGQQDLIKAYKGLVNKNTANGNEYNQQIKANMDKIFDDFTDMLMKKANQKDPNLKLQVVRAVRDLWLIGNSGTTIQLKVKNQFPQLKPRIAQP